MAQRIIFLESHLVKGFIKKGCFKQFFNKKIKDYPPFCGGVFVYSGWLGGLYDSLGTNRSAPGGGGFLQPVFFASNRLPGII
jgi:hypothetical protein